MPDVVAVSPALTGLNANPPKSLKTHTDTRTKVVNSHALVSHVNQSGGGGPRNVFATPPSSYSSKAIPQYSAVRLLVHSSEVSQSTVRLPDFVTGFLANESADALNTS